MLLASWISVNRLVVLTITLFLIGILENLWPTVI